ncbi:MAG: rod shape-determining protein MreD [Hydrogenibacillus sp.]|nr:rod shape-determining protein MreD [Hydrogenibacillus sp.]
MRGFLSFLLFFGALVADFTLAHLLLPGSLVSQYPVRLRFALTLLTVYAFARGAERGAAVGAVLGLATDMAFGRAIGPNLYFDAVWGLLAGEARRIVYRNIWTAALLSGLAALLNDAFLYGLFRLFRWTEVEPEYWFRHQAMWDALLGAALCLLLYPLGSVFRDSDAEATEAADGEQEGAHER